MSQCLRLLVCFLICFSLTYAEETKPSLDSTAPWNLEASSMEPVKARLISEQSSISSKQPFWVAIHFKIEDHWHTYWKNPGQTGMPISIEWDLPPGFSVAKAEWPYPHLFRQDGAVGYGYEKDVYFLAQIIPPADYQEKDVTLKANLRWVACSDSNCMPGSEDLALTLPLSSSPTNATASLQEFAKARSQLPHEQWEVAAFKKEGLVLVQVKTPEAYPHHFIKGYFFPEEEGKIDGMVDPILTKHDEHKGLYSIVLKAMDDSRSASNELKGILVLVSEGSAHVEEPLIVNIPWSSSADHFVGMSTLKTSLFKDASAANLASVPLQGEPFEGGFWLALGFAFLGGLILNLMPCVLPVVSFKILSFVKMAGQDRSKTLKHGLAFSGGVLASFWVLAAVLLSLQAYGKSVGWGFQLQEPIFVAVLAAVLLVFGLSLFGVMEIGTSLIALANNQGKGKEESLGESFFSGVLATAVATPCTGPFLGSAVGFAITLSPILGMIIFTSLGLGMAFPYLLLSAYPKLLKFMPKPGKWMVSFKELMGFMMLATVLWLVWVFSAETSSIAVCFLLGAFLMLGLGSWIYGKWAAPYRSRQSRIIGKLLTLGCAVLAFYVIVQASSPALADQPREMVQHQEWEEFSAERLAALRAEGTPVFIDFTARWCLICQANKMALNHQTVSQKFKEKGVVRIRADWTRNDPAITEELRKYGRNGVPLYVLLDVKLEKGAHILPQVLTPDVVMGFLDKLESSETAAL